MKIVGERFRGHSRIDRAFIVSVVIARYHHHRHRGACNLAHRERHGFFANPARIEQVADNQYEVHLSLVGDGDDLAEVLPYRTPHPLSGLAQAEAVAFEMNIRGMQQPQRFFWFCLHVLYFSTPARGTAPMRLTSLKMILA